MATYKFAISMQVLDMLPRNRFVNVVHFDHVAGIALDTDLEAICDDLCDLYISRLGAANEMVTATAYDVGAVPNPPKASVTKGDNPFLIQGPGELAICLSFAGDRYQRRQRGRIYLPFMLANPVPSYNQPNVPAASRQWALDWYTVSNASFPDIGGIDWKFGVYSKTNAAFYQATYAWVDDDWDVQRRRGFKATARTEATREG